MAPLPKIVLELNRIRDEIAQEEHIHKDICTMLGVRWSSSSLASSLLIVFTLVVTNNKG